MHGILPLKSILFNRHIGTLGICPLCNSNDEDILHMIFKCDGAALEGVEIRVFDQ
jgi:hypothetical protein